MAIHHAKLINYVNINQAKHRVKKNRDLIKGYEESVQTLSKENEILKTKNVKLDNALKIIQIMREMREFKVK